MFPACTSKYSTLKELEARKDSIPTHFMEKYIVDVEIAVMDAALKKYRELMDNGYDKKIKIYSEYVEAQVQD
jgi:hypothetical protein